jgi:sulfoxide reductase catalytic subunit YedY
MIIKRPSDIPSSEITPESIYSNRRAFLRTAGVAGAGLALAGAGILSRARRATAQQQGDDEITKYEKITTYNNFYEFGTGKGDPAKNSKNFQTSPWSVQVSGMVKNPATYALEDFLKPSKIQDRTYRMRCVEAWSMIIPWQGIPLSDVLRRADPLPSAKFVEFVTLLDPKQMPTQQYPILHWPYLEGLRLDEAMHPLTILATGIYGKPLLPQNGAPIRLVVPWKYGFKGCKSIVQIRLTDKMPETAWMRAAPDEYGFYANVNPNVDHPRWSQKRERVNGEFRTKPTLMFNGYGEQVAQLYAGMDLRANY